MVIFECKKDNLESAKSDIKHYFKNMNMNDIELTIFGVAYVSDALYEIYKMSASGACRSLSNKTISLTSFDIMRDAIFTGDLKLEIKQIHSYIHEHTRISNEDKPLFMAIILIGLKNNLLIDTIDKVLNKDNVYMLLETILTTFDFTVNVFNHLSHDRNKQHLYTLVKMVNDIYVQCPSVDLLNEFYSEFIKYGNTDSKSLGIVLTPPHIVSIMTKMLNIGESDVVLDLCTGTGSFLLEAATYNPKQIIGCEYQLKLFNLLKCNMIIRNIENYDIYHGDCFSHEFKATKSMINPPYSTNTNEWEFIAKQLDSISDNGECCAIVPNSTINDKASNVCFKQMILERAHVLSIIICRSTLFYPVANVGTVILHLRKGTNPEQLTKIVDYRDDGFVSKRNRGMVKDGSFDDKLNQLWNSLSEEVGVRLTPNANWYKLSVALDTSIDIKELKSSMLQLDYYESVLALDELRVQDTQSHSTELLDVSVDTYFKLITKPEAKYTESKRVLQIAAKNNSNGIKGIVDSTEDTFTGNKLTVIVSGDGGAGLCYYQSSDFIISSAVKVLAPRDNIKLDKYMGVFIANQLGKNKQIYNRGNTWKTELIKETMFRLPFKDGKIDYNHVKSMFA